VLKRLVEETNGTPESSTSPRRFKGLLVRAIATKDGAVAFALLKTAERGPFAWPVTYLNKVGDRGRHHVEGREEAG